MPYIDRTDDIYPTIQKLLRANHVDFLCWVIGVAKNVGISVFTVSGEALAIDEPKKSACSTACYIGGGGDSCPCTPGEYTKKNWCSLEFWVR